MASVSSALLVEINERRLKATVAGDIRGLDSLFHDDLIFVHTNGTAEGKRVFLAALEGGQRKYHLLGSIETHISDRAGVPVVTGKCDVESEVGGKIYVLTTAYTAIYSTEERPRLIGYHATILGE